MKRVFFHVGLTKTGTTALQLFLSSNRKLFEKIDIGYYRAFECRRDCEGNALFLLDQILHSKQNSGYRTIPLSENRKASSRESERFTEYAEIYDKLILSEELISYHCVAREDFWEIAREYIRMLVGDDCSICPVIYLRRQDEWSISLWRLVMNEKIPIADTYRRMVEIDESLGRYDYYKRLRRIESAFGKENMIVRVYDRDKFHNGDICRDFMEALSVPWIEELSQIEGDINPSLTMGAAAAMRLINAGEMGEEYTTPEKRNVLRSAARTFSYMFPESENYHFLTLKERRRFMDRYSESNRAVARRYFDRERLFTDEIRTYTVWTPDREREKKNAEYIIKLAKAGSDSRKWIVDHLGNNNVWDHRPIG